MRKIVNEKYIRDMAVEDEKYMVEKLTSCSCYFSQEAVPTVVGSQSLREGHLKAKGRIYFRYSKRKEIVIKLSITLLQKSALLGAVNFLL